MELLTYLKGMINITITMINVTMLRNKLHRLDLAEKYWGRDNSRELLRRSIDVVFGIFLSVAHISRKPLSVIPVFCDGISGTDLGRGHDGEVGGGWWLPEGRN